MEQRAKARGAALLAESLKIDRHPKDTPGLVEEWSAKLAEKL